MTIEMNPENYTKQEKEYDILGLKVHAKPLKLRWKILFQPLSTRITAFTKKESGLTDEEIKDSEYGGFMKLFEAKFFSKEYDPNPDIEKQKDEELQKIAADFVSGSITEDVKKKKIDAAAAYYKHILTGRENLIELLSAMIQGEIDWNKFIDEHQDKYDDIRKIGLELYEDFFTEIYLLKKT